MTPMINGRKLLMRVYKKINNLIKNSSNQKRFWKAKERRMKNIKKF